MQEYNNELKHSTPGNRSICLFLIFKHLHMKPYLIILFILSAVTLSQAQDSLSHSSPDAIMRLSMGPSPEGYYPFTLLPSVERRQNNIGLLLQTGMMIPRYYRLKDTLSNQLIKGYAQWYTIRGEIRKYKHLRDNFIPGKREVYIGIELFANYYRTPRFDEYYSPGNDKIYKDAFVLTKKMIGAGIVFGKQRFIGKHVFVGLHTGLGVKLKYTTAGYNRYDDAITTYIHGMFMTAADKVGFSAALAMPINFSVGYVFR